MAEHLECPCRHSFVGLRRFNTSRSYGIQMVLRRLLQQTCVSEDFFKIKLKIFGYVDPNTLIYVLIIKINNFRGDLSDISDTTATITCVWRVQEEKRLAHVAVTRAKTHLFLTSIRLNHACNEVIERSSIALPSSVTIHDHPESAGELAAKRKSTAKLVAALGGIVPRHIRTALNDDDAMGAPHHDEVEPMRNQQPAIVAHVAARVPPPRQVAAFVPALQMLQRGLAVEPALEAPRRIHSAASAASPNAVPAYTRGLHSGKPRRVTTLPRSLAAGVLSLCIFLQQYRIQRMKNELPRATCFSYFSCLSRPLNSWNTHDALVPVCRIKSCVVGV